MDGIVNKKPCVAKSGAPAKEGISLWSGSSRLPKSKHKYLQIFKGAKLSVLVWILLRGTDDGWVEADISQLERETGYRKHSIERAVRGLCKLEVEGQRIMIAVAERKRRYARNKIHFRLFPTPVDIVRYGSSS